jgi:hypothetical protein
LKGGSASGGGVGARAVDEEEEEEDEDVEGEEEEEEEEEAETEARGFLVDCFRVGGFGAGAVAFIAAGVVSVSCSG